jgi:hypothetical protein
MEILQEAEVSEKPKWVICLIVIDYSFKRSKTTCISNQQNLYEEATLMDLMKRLTSKKKKV